MAECPRCSQPLHERATWCGCGWKSRTKKDVETEAARPIVHCAYDTCDIPAICKVKTPTGLANFCLPHYERYHEDRSHEALEIRGLGRLADETKAEHMARLRKWFREHDKLKTFADAEKKEEAA